MPLTDFRCRSALSITISAALGLALMHQSASAQQLSIEEVIVTAQKREQNLQDVPVAVTALSAKTIEKLGIVTAADVVRITPSMTVGQSNNKTNSGFRIRGIGTNVFGIGVEQAVSMVIDDVAMIQQGQSMTNLVDIERIEVLRGPQSTLFGKAASAGVINVVTKGPAEEFEGTVEASYTDESEKRVLGSLSGPIGDSLGYRITGSWYDHDGWGNNLSPGFEGKHSFEDGYSFRGKLRWTPSDTIEATLGAHYSEEESDCCARIFRVFDTENGRILGFIPEPPAEGITPSEDNTTVRRDTPANSNTDSEGVNLRLSFDFGEFTLLSVSAYDKWEYSNDEDVDFSDIPANFYLTDGADNVGWFSNSWRSQEFISQEFRLVSPSYESYDYLIGAYYSDSEIDRTFFRTVPVALSDYEASAGTEQLALFGQFNWHLSAATTLAMGLRVFEEEISASAQDFAPGATPPASGSNSDSDVVGKVSLQHNFADDIMAFASFTRGYKGQAFDVTSDFDEFRAANPVAPEISDAFELGIKSELWGGRMQLNGTAFYTVYEDFQVQATAVDDEGFIFFSLNNAGELVTQGLELETITLLSESLTFIFNAAYIDAEVNDYAGAACYYDQDEATGCDPITDTQTIDGGTLPNTPEWKYTAMLDYDQELNSMPFDLFANVIYTWQDEVRFGISQNPLTTQDSYGITNVRLGIRDKSDRYELSLFGNNVFDEGYTGGQLDASFLYQGTSDPTLIHMVPRNAQRYWGVKAKLNF